ncbi:hypothetical protein DM01DRAFT_1340852 [Hesseltinella vesiculosa]|uniref:BIR-domain-containing protein n=1 Tax=Hesseltinella vesiculosa TaxID=101127 RepID=A0A1X2G2Q9_9FUNG|nr:hypothetical protein DM01DRAFT_1340852 [Hesseltinella vesiculosa]
MNIFSTRLETFEKHKYPWPHGDRANYSTINECASAGLYNVATAEHPDKLKCYLCDVEMADWKSGQSPLARHSLESPDCPFVILNFPGNLSSSPAIDDGDHSTHPESDRMMRARLATFNKDNAWETKTKSRPSPANLKAIQLIVDAGFIFLPTITSRTRMFCPYCHLTIEKYYAGKRGDIISIHRQRRPNCPFVARHTRVENETEQLINPSKRATTETRSSTGSQQKRRRTQSQRQTSTPEPPQDLDNDQENQQDLDQKSKFDSDVWDFAKQKLVERKPALATLLSRPGTDTSRSSSASTDHHVLVSYGSEKKKYHRHAFSTPMPPTARRSNPSNMLLSEHLNISKHRRPADFARPTIASQSKGHTSSQPTTRGSSYSQARDTSRAQRDKGKAPATEELPHPVPTTLPRTRSYQQDSLKTADGMQPPPGRSSEPVRTTNGHTSQQPSFSPPMSARHIPMQSTPVNNRFGPPQSFFSSLAASPIRSRADPFMSGQSSRASDPRATLSTNKPVPSRYPSRSMFSGNLDTPMLQRTTSVLYTGDVAKDIENQFMANRRRPPSPSQQPRSSINPDAQSSSVKKPKRPSESPESATYSEPDDEPRKPLPKQPEPPLVLPLRDKGGPTAEAPAAAAAPTQTPPFGQFWDWSKPLTEEELNMTVEEFIEHMAETKTEQIKTQGQAAIAEVCKHVVATRHSLLSMDP